MNNLGRRLVDRECGEYQRLVTEPCNNQPCPKWSVSEWSEVGTPFLQRSQPGAETSVTSTFIYCCVSFSMMAALSQFCCCKTIKSVLFFLSTPPPSAW